MTFDTGGRTIKYRQLNQNTPVSIDTSDSTLGDALTSSRAPLTNKSGGDRSVGDVVIVDLDNDEAFETTITEAVTDKIIGVLAEDIAVDAIGLVILSGKVEQVNLGGSIPLRGDFLYTSTTAGRGLANEARGSGAFAQVIEAAADGAAILFGVTDSASVFFNVRDYGAVGDGTTNDTTAVQAACTAAAISGGIVYFPAGTYLVGALTVGKNVRLLGVGRESSVLMANANSITIVTITGTTQVSTLEVDFASPIEGLGFDANSKTGCTGVKYVGVAYNAAKRCTFDGFLIGLDVFGSLQSPSIENKYLSCETGLRFTAQAIGYYVALPQLPPNRVWSIRDTFYYNTDHAIDYSGGQGLGIDNIECGDNGTDADETTSAIKVRITGDAHGPGVVTTGINWLESNHGFAVFDLGGTTETIHDLGGLVWMAYNDSTYSIAVDGSSASQTLLAHSVLHDKLVSPATVNTFFGAGTCHLDVRWSNGSLAGTWTSVRQEPLLDETLVSDFSDWLAVRLPNLTTAERDAIATPTAGMVIFNTTTTRVEEYDGSAWEAISSSTTRLLTIDPGTVTYNHAGDDVIVSVTSVWGYDAEGPYYDDAGVTSGEEGILALDPEVGDMTVIPYNP